MVKVKERIIHKIISLTYKTLESAQPVYLSNILTLLQHRSTRSSTLVTLQRPTNPSRSKIVDGSFYLTAPQIWNSLPPHLRQSCTNHAAKRVCALSHSQFYAQLK